MKRVAVWLGLVLAVMAAAWAADELSVTTGWAYSKNGRVRTMAPTTVRYDIAGISVVENVQTVSTNTTGDALVLGGVTNAGFAYLHNLETNNYIEVGVYDALTNFVVVIKLNGGEAQTCWLGITAPRARANTAAGKLDYMISDR